MATPKTSKDKRSRLWAEPARARDKGGESYTKFVRRLRLLLPLAAAALAGLLVAWPSVDRTITQVQTESAKEQAVGRNELINPRFESEDRESRPFVVTALRAVQNSKDPDIVVLESPAANLTLLNKSVIGAAAAQGAWKQKDEKLLLEGHVTLRHNSGYEMKTEKILIDMRTQQAWSETRVEGKGPAGTLTAQGLQAEAVAGTLVFTGPVRLVMNKAVAGL